MSGAPQFLLIQTAFVGDLLLGIPLLKRLRRLERDARITLYCRRGLGDFLLKAGLVDEVIEVDKSSRDSFREANARLRAKTWDWVLCPHQSLRSHVLVHRLKARRKTGYKRAWNGLIFDDRVRRPMLLPEALRQLALIASEDAEVRAGLATFSQVAQEGRLPELASRAARLMAPVPAWADMCVDRLRAIRDIAMTKPEMVGPLLSPRARAFAQEHHLLAGLMGHEPIVFLAPGSVWPTKMWTEEGYATCARTLLARRHRVVLVGAPNEKMICERIQSRAPGAVILAGETSLWESAELMTLGSYIVCNDSGAMHMAASAGLPSVAIFGPTTLELGYRPWQTNARVVQEDLGCRPCGRHGSKRCPLGTHACMKMVEAEVVLREAEALVKTSTGEIQEGRRADG